MDEKRVCSEYSLLPSAASSGGDAEEVMALGVRDGLLVPESCSQRAGACELEPTSIGETHGRWAWGMVGGTLCGQEGGVLLFL